jgi:hypothetical protein
MKRNLFTTLLVFCMLMAASDCSRTKTVPFDVEFTGTYNLVEPDSLLCGPEPWMHVIVDCSGTGTPLGKFTTHFDFCANWEEGYYPGTRSVEYMIAENGDTLFITCEGQVIEGRLEDHPEYVVEYWRDPFKILGGTGKYEGATGEGMTDDYNSSEDQNSHHHWKGTITMLK